MNTVIVKNAGHSFAVSVRDEADASVLAEIFKVHEYRSIDSLLANATFPVLDVGAHAGFFTLYARSLNEKVKIIAVEPEKYNCAQFKKHITENIIKNTKLVQAAVAGISGKQDLYLSRDSHNHSLVKETDASQNVATFSLSELMKKCILTKISLIKMDIEGGEYDFFDGVTDDDFEKVGAFFIEYHTVAGRNYKDIEQLLREHRYGVQHFPSKFDKSMGFLIAQRKIK
jgi:FkbM family methyltransferase